jgi:phage tail tape-measure protein
MGERKDVDGVDKAKVDAAAGGTMAGGTAGALIGAAVGGPAGAGIGGVVGSAVGGAAGAAFDYSSAEPELRDEWERGPYKASSTWDEASSAYRYGWESYDRPEHRDRTWQEVREPLRKGWPHTTPWDDYEPMVRSAWDRRARLG